MVSNENPEMQKDVLQPETESIKEPAEQAEGALPEKTPEEMPGIASVSGSHEPDWAAAARRMPQKKEPEGAARIVYGILWYAGICLVAFLMIIAGGLISMVWLDPAEVFTDPAGTAFGMYLEPWGGWASLLLLCLVVRSYRPLFGMLYPAWKKKAGDIHRGNIYVYDWKDKRYTPEDKSLWSADSLPQQGNSLKALAGGIGLGFLFNGTCALAAFLHGDVVWTVNPLMAEPINALWVVPIFLAVIVQSGQEEITCRGYVYHRLRVRLHHPLIPIVGNSVFFAALHLANPGVNFLGMYSLVATGIFMSMIIYYYGSMWFVIGFHAMWNFTQSILLGLPNSGIVLEYSVLKLDAASATNSFAYNTGFGIEGTILADLILTVGCIVVYMINRKKKAAAA